MSACKGCGAAIVWVTTSKGRKMPCDADDVTTDDRTRLLYRANGKRAELDVWGWVWGYAPHWPTCQGQGKQFQLVKSGRK